MKVKELIEELKELDPEMVVVLSEDAEGNRYNEARTVGVGLFNESEKEFYDEETLEDDYDEDEVNEIRGDSAKCICLWP